VLPAGQQQSAPHGVWLPGHLGTVVADGSGGGAVGWGGKVAWGTSQGIEPTIVHEALLPGHVGA
jgi:hypothetical protein